MIEDFHFGSMMISGKTYRHDLTIVDGEVIPRWRRIDGHVVGPEDVADILSAKPDVLVIGMGQPGRMQSTDSLRSALREAGIQLIEEPTEDAIRTFNHLQSTGRRVAGAFHLTC